MSETPNQQQQDQLHILVVEDDASLAEWIFDYLTDHGYLVTVANRGDTAVEMVKTDDPDLVVLDVMLPEKDGFQVCTEVRHFYHKPVLMLTARGEESDEVRGLECGADDYLAKPVRPKVLLARIKLLLNRRGQIVADDHHIVGSLSIDLVSRTVKLHDDDVSLSSQEFELLCLLVENAGKVMSREQLVSRMRGINYDGFDRSIDINISRLRKKLGDSSGNPSRIKTVRGKGYLLAVDAW